MALLVLFAWLFGLLSIKYFKFRFNLSKWLNLLAETGDTQETLNDHVLPRRSILLWLYSWWIKSTKVPPNDSSTPQYNPQLQTKCICLSENQPFGSPCDATAPLPAATRSTLTRAWQMPPVFYHPGHRAVNIQYLLIDICIWYIYIYHYIYQ